MLRLLLENDKKIIRREYLLRFLNMLLLYTVIGVSFWIFALMPSYLYLRTESGILSQQVEKENNSQLAKERAELKKTVFDLNTKVSVLGSGDYVVSKFIRKITGVQTGHISIESISFSNSADSSVKGKMELRGIASNRESLLDFSQNLESIDDFESVVLPFSNFASNEDIPFLITIEINENNRE